MKSEQCFEIFQEPRVRVMQSLCIPNFKSSTGKIRWHDSISIYPTKSNESVLLLWWSPAACFDLGISSIVLGKNRQCLDLTFRETLTGKWDGIECWGAKMRRIAGNGNKIFAIKGSKAIYSEHESLNFWLWTVSLLRLLGTSPTWRKWAKALVASHMLGGTRSPRIVACRIVRTWEAMRTKSLSLATVWSSARTPYLEYRSLSQIYYHYKKHVLAEVTLKLEQTVPTLPEGNRKFELR